MTLVTSSQWDDFCSQHGDVHILQTSTWGKFKSEFGWNPAHLVVEDTGALVLTRKGPLGMRIAYIPRGPVGKHWDVIWSEVHRYCRCQKVIFIKVEPDLWEPNLTTDGNQNRVIFPRGFHESMYNIQPRRSILIDISKPVDVLLGQMKQKTRYNIKLAARKGVIARDADDVKTFFDLLQITGERDSFGIHNFAYYHKVFSLFTEKDQCKLFLADYKGEVIAGIMVFINSRRAWYFYGASSRMYSELMPNYLLQWEAMLWAKSRGCSLYDLWGIPDESEDFLEANYLNRVGDLWGVYRFKRGFGGDIKRTVGSWEWAYSPVIFRLYHFYLDRIRKTKDDRVLE
jgi:peptidoglycan pentaglycine glycine transferase (the first glycine)